MLPLHQKDSFPSSHALYGLYLGHLLGYPWLMGLALSYSRVVMGVHHPSDVLAGFCLGGFWYILLV